MLYHLVWGMMGVMHIMHIFFNKFNKSYTGLDLWMQNQQIWR